MSTFWTPDGERPVNGERAVNSESAADSETPVQQPGEPTPEQLEALRAQLAQTPASVVVANHCFGLFELAALHLSLAPPQLDEAQVAIDALGAIVEGLEGRLGEPEPQLVEGLTQLRMAFVQIKQAVDSEN